MKKEAKRKEGQIVLNNGYGAARYAVPVAPLPKGIKPGDTVYPSMGTYKKNKYVPHPEHVEGSPSFELWHSQVFGWCIPTLLIRGRGRRYGPSANSDRTYAARVSDGGLVRIGMGPHVTQQTTVYARKSRMADLKPYFEMQNKGQGDAGIARDNLSTRRARGSLRRSVYSW